MSVSGADTIRIQCTHTEELLPGSLRGPVRAWQGLKVVSSWLPNDTLKHIVRTSQNAEGIKVAPTEVWGSEEGSEEGKGPTELRNAAGGL